MNTASNSMPWEANRSQSEPVRALEGSCGKARRAQAVLVGDHDEAEARPLEVEQRGDDAGHQADLLQAVDLLVGGSSISVPSRSTNRTRRRRLMRRPPRRG